MAEGLQGGIGAVSLLGAPPVIGGGMATVVPAKVLADKNPKKPLTDEELQKFGDFAGTTDTKEIAKYLMKKGLVGASQLYTDTPNIATKEGIVNSQSDWKPAAMSKMLARARMLGLKTPTEIAANKAALIGALDDRIKQAISKPEFEQIHPNWWSTFDSILKDQYAKEGA